MPVYEYRCLACGQTVDRLLPHTQADQPGPCPACDGELERQFSRIGVRYGSWGFNATDNLVPDRPGRNDFKTVSQKSEELFD